MIVALLEFIGNLVLELLIAVVPRRQPWKAIVLSFYGVAVAGVVALVVITSNTNPPAQDPGPVARPTVSPAR